MTVIELDVVRRCLVCDAEATVSEPETADVIGPPCASCHAPTERIRILARHQRRHPANPHAAALGRLGGLKGGRARAAMLSPERRRDIARRAALARWRRHG